MVHRCDDRTNVSGDDAMTPFYWLVLGVLITWRVTHLLSNENGPWNLLEKLRFATGTSVLAELLACFYCLSLWIAAPLAWILASGWRHRLLLWLALSGGAILLERLSSRNEPPAPIILQESEDSNVLRSET
jgi:hypothetical protein